MKNLGKWVYKNASKLVDQESPSYSQKSKIIHTHCLELVLENKQKNLEFKVSKVL